MELNLLKELTAAFAPSGCEKNVSDIIKREIESYCDDLYYTKLGSLIAVLRGTGNRSVLVSAHMDEVGFMVTHVDDDGYLHFGLIGGIDSRVLSGRRVIIGESAMHGGIKGIIMSKAVHLQSESERKEVTPVKNMVIDIGAKNKEEAEKYAPKGTFGTFDSEFVLFGKDNKMLKAKAIDDRLGCAVMCDTIKRLRSEGVRYDYDIYFVFSVHEEIGFPGVGASVFGIDPDRAIVLEATAVADIFDVTPSMQVAKTGEGGVISFADLGTIYDREFIDFAFATGRKYNIKCQMKQYVSGSNDAAHIQRAGLGTKIIAVSAPCRYLHSASNVISIEDYYSINDLIYYLLKDLNESIDKI
ncbi:MAG: M20/M25/M40 family metallo-hydrolase [Oscillospiraceae bacterium]|nr:M20/M25/M40 family metallo-hydrolase [Oscillospiraceae bacterium]